MLIAREHLGRGCIYVVCIATVALAHGPAYSSTIVPDHLGSLQEVAIFVHVHSVDTQDTITHDLKQMIEELAASRLEEAGIQLRAGASSYMTIEVNLCSCGPDQRSIAAALTLALVEDVELTRSPGRRLTEGAATWTEHDLLVSSARTLQCELRDSVDHWLEHFASLVSLARKTLDR